MADIYHLQAVALTVAFWGQGVRIMMAARRLLDTIKIFSSVPAMVV